MLTIRLLKSFEATVDGKRLKLSPTLCRFLAYLALNAGQTVEKSAIGKAIWQNGWPAVQADVSTAMYRLGVALPSVKGWISNSSLALCLELDDVEVDVRNFEILISKGDPEALAVAVEIYSGELLGNWEENWITPERGRLKVMFEQTLEKLAARSMALGNFQDAIRYRRALLIENAFLERAWEDLIIAAFHIGDRLCALNAYEDYLKVLRSLNAKHGVEYHPSQQIEDLIDAANHREQTHIIQQITGNPCDPVVPRGSAPITVLEPVGGSVPLGSPYYIERAEDIKLKEHIQQIIVREGQTLLIKGPRQIGKSSLLLRLGYHAKQAGARVIRSDWQNLPQSVLASSEAFYFETAGLFAYQLHQEMPPKSAFHSDFHPSTIFERYVRDDILEQRDAPLVWMIDEADRLFSCDFYGDVFGKLRSWHNDRSDPESPFRRLTIVIAYSTEASLFIKDPRQSPFNVGTKFTLHDLTPEQTAEINNRYGNPLTHSGELTRLYGLTSGHPYLVRLVLHTLCENQIGMAEIEAQAEREDGIFAEHLGRIRFAFSVDEPLKMTVQKALRDGVSPSEQDFVRLCAAGLMTGGSRAEMRPRCRLYELFLRRHLLS